MAVRKAVPIPNVLRFVDNNPIPLHLCQRASENLSLQQVVKYR